MKFSKATLALAASLAFIGSTHAATVTATAGNPVALGGTDLSFVQGSGTLSFSAGSGFDGKDPNTLGGLIGALNVGKVVITGVGGATVAEDGLTVDGEFTRTSSAASAQVVGVTIDPATGKVLSVASTGGANQLGTRISGTLTGGTATVTNLTFDLANKRVVADLSGTKAAVGTTAAVNFSLPGTTLWTIDSITGPTTIPVASLSSPSVVNDLVAAGFTFDGLSNGKYNFSAVNVISGLKVTTEGFAFFKNSLGLLSTGQNALNAVNTDVQGWGSVNSKLSFSISAVPEPSTYLLSLIGVGMLVGTKLARRRSTQG
jgi:hypothetical protein